MPIVEAKEGDLGRGGRFADRLAEAGDCDWLPEFCVLLKSKGERGGWLEPLPVFPGPGDLLFEPRNRALLQRYTVSDRAAKG